MGYIDDMAEWGGAREGAGRPKRNETVVKAGLNEEELRTLDAYQALHELSSRAKAIRRLINVSARQSLKRAE